MPDDKFAQVAYLYILAAESQCEKRVSEISRARTATNSGFGALTMISAIAGSAIGTTTGANAASGLAAIFNSLSANTDGIQNQITSQYSNNIATAIIGKQTLMIEGKIDNDPNSIRAKLSDLIKTGSSAMETAKQSEIHYELSKLNPTCTISAGEREIEQKLGGFNQS